MTRRAAAKWAARATIGALFVVAVMLLVPWHPADIADPPERAWALALHLAFVRGLVFGREFVFSFGPFGFLWRGFHPSTYRLAVIAWVFIAAVFVEALWALARRRSPRPAASAIVAVAVFTILIKGRESLLLALPLLWYFEGRRSTTTLRFALLTAAVGIVALGKFSVLLFAAPLALLLAIDEALRRRRFPVSSVLFASAIAAWWVAAEQNLRDVPLFLANSLDLASNFGDAMSYGPRWAVPPLWPFAVAALLLVLFTFAAAREDGRPWPLLDTLAVAAACYIGIKSGFVRWDFDHAPAAYGLLILTMLMVAAVLWPSREPSPGILLLSIALPFLAAAGALLFYEDRSTPRVVQSFRDAFRLARGESPAPIESLQKRYDRFLADAESLAAPFEIGATADVYPVMASAVAARREYSPRPVPQSYAVVSARLAELNARHLRERPPESILFEFPPGWRFAALDDSLSWPQILARYEVAARGPRFVHLRRRAAPRGVSFRTLRHSSVELGEAIPAPEGGLTWAVIRVRRTVRGRIVSILFRTRPVLMDVRTADGRERAYRLPADLAAGGFLLSPVIGEPADLAALIEGSVSPQKRVVAVRVRAQAWCYERRIEVVFKGLELTE